jgi:hypothetical protein
MGARSVPDPAPAGRGSGQAHVPGPTPTAHARCSRALRRERRGEIEEYVRTGEGERARERDGERRGGGGRTGCTLGWCKVPACLCVHAPASSVGRSHPELII